MVNLWIWDPDDSGTLKFAWGMVCGAEGISVAGDKTGIQNTALGTGETCLYST